MAYRLSLLLSLICASGCVFQGAGLVLPDIGARDGGIVFADAPNDIPAQPDTNTDAPPADGPIADGPLPDTSVDLSPDQGPPRNYINYTTDAGVGIRLPLTASGDRIYGAWGFGPNDVWLVGAEGTVLHYDGDHFSRLKIPPVYNNRDLRGVWGRAQDDVWIVGEFGLILHFAGSTIDAVAAPVGTQTLLGVHGDAVNTWFTGGARTLKYDGSMVTTEDTSSRNHQSIWVDANGTPWVATNNAKPRVRNASGIFVDQDIGASGKTLSVFGIGNQVWFGTDAGEIIRCSAGCIAPDSAGWVGDTLPPDADDIKQIFSPDNGVLYAADEGRILQRDNVTDTWNALFSSNSVQIEVGWASSGAPFNGYLGVSTGSTYEFVQQDLPQERRTYLRAFRGVEGNSTETYSIGASGGKGFLHVADSSGWRDVTTVSDDVRDLWIAPSGNIYTVGKGLGVNSGGLHVWNPSSKNLSEITGSEPRVLHTVFGINDQMVWAAGDDTHFVLYDGSSVTQIALPGVTGTVDFRGGWASSATDAYIVGTAGTVVHFDGSSWQQVDLSALSIGTPLFNAVHGNGPNNVWVAGTTTNLLHFDGTTWSKIDLATLLPGVSSSANLTDLHVTAGGHVWITASTTITGNVLIRFDGNSWSSLAMPLLSGAAGISQISPRKVWARDNQDVWAVGLSSAAVHFNDL